LDLVQQARLRSFLSALYRECPQDSFTTIVTFDKPSAPPKSVDPIRVGELDQLIELIDRRSQEPTADVYFRPSVMQNRPAPGSRGTELDALGCATLYIDIDYYKTSYTQEQVLEALQRFDRPPTFITNTGNGLQAFWLLKTFCTDIIALKTRNKWLAQQFKRFSADAIHDLARVLRTPETINYKHEMKPTSVVLADTSRYYTLSEFGMSPLDTIEETLRGDPIDEVPLSEDWLEKLEKDYPLIAERILTEEGAERLGAKTGNRSSSRVDRSSNDATIALMLLSHGYPPGEVMSVLKHPRWFSGSKYREGRQHRYVESTVQWAQAKVSTSSVWEFFEKKTFLPRKMMDAIQKAGETVVSVGGRLYYYSDGVFLPNGENFLQREVFWRLKDMWKESHPKETVAIFQQNAPDATSWTEPALERPELHDVWLNTKSGMLNASTLELAEHSHAYRSFAQLPVYYAPDVDTTFVSARVREILAPDAYEAFWEYMGYCLLPDVRFRKSLLLLGMPHTGKSTLLDMIRTFFGQTNTSSISLQELCDSRFGLAGLVGKIVNAYADLDSTEVRNAGQFKMLCSGDRVQVEFKYYQAYYTVLLAKHIFSANNPTPVTDPDDAYFDRWLVMRCDRVFQRDKAAIEDIADLRLINKLTSEESMSAFLVLALRGLHRLMKNESFTEGSSMQEALAQYQASTDAVHAFLMDQVESRMGAFTSKMDLLAAYQQWAGVSNRGYSLSDRKFFLKVRDKLPKFKVREGYKDIDGKSTNGYHGMFLKANVMTITLAQLHNQ